MKEPDVNIFDIVVFMEGAKINSPIERIIMLTINIIFLRFLESSWLLVKYLFRAVSTSSNFIV